MPIASLELQCHASSELDRLLPDRLQLNAPVVGDYTQHKNFKCPKSLWQPHILIVGAGRIALQRKDESSKPKLQVQHYLYAPEDKEYKHPLDDMLLFAEAVPELVLERSSRTGLWELHEENRQVVQPEAAGPLRAFILLVTLAGIKKQAVEQSLLA